MTYSLKNMSISHLRHFAFKVSKRCRIQCSSDLHGKWKPSHQSDKLNAKEYYGRRFMNGYMSRGTPAYRPLFMWCRPGNVKIGETRRLHEAPSDVTLHERRTDLGPGKTRSRDKCNAYSEPQRPSICSKVRSLAPGPTLSFNFVIMPSLRFWNRSSLASHASMVWSIVSFIRTSATAVSATC